MFTLGRARSSCLQSTSSGGGGGMMLRVVAVGVVLVLAAVAAPDESRVLAQTTGGDLRFEVPVRAPAAPDSPVLARSGHTWGQTTNSFRLPGIGRAPITVYPGMTGIRVEMFNSGGSYRLSPGPDTMPINAAQRPAVENSLVVLVTRLNTAGDALFAMGQDTFVLEPSGWTSPHWFNSGNADRATRFTTLALGTATNRSQWYIISVDKNVPGVDIDETAQRFLYVPPPPPSDDTPPAAPAAPARVTGVRVSPLDGGLRVSWSAAAGEVSQYRVDAADASGELVRRVYTEVDVHEALLDHLVNGVEYTVTVTALTSHPDVEGPASETTMATPRVGGDGDGDTEDVPVPALPLAGAGVLAGLLTSAACRFRRARRRASRAVADRREGR